MSFKLQQTTNTQQNKRKNNLFHTAGRVRIQRITNFAILRFNNLSVLTYFPTDDRHWMCISEQTKLTEEKICSTISISRPNEAPAGQANKISPEKEIMFLVQKCLKEKKYCPVLINITQPTVLGWSRIFWNFLQTTGRGLRSSYREQNHMACI